MFPSNRGSDESGPFAEANRTRWHAYSKPTLIARKQVSIIASAITKSNNSGADRSHACDGGVTLEEWHNGCCPPALPPPVCRTFGLSFGDRFGSLTIHETAGIFGKGYLSATRDGRTKQRAAPCSHTSKNQVDLFRIEDFFGNPLMVPGHPLRIRHCDFYCHFCHSAGQSRGNEHAASTGGSGEDLRQPVYL